ncbi:hypothetical protein Tco_0173724 [Tanacetum coccineum]
MPMWIADARSDYPPINFVGHGAKGYTGLRVVRRSSVDGVWKVGACEDVLGGLNKDERNAIMDASMALFGEFLAATSDNVYSPKVFILKPVSYAGAASASSAVQKKGRANFRPLEYENVCDGVNLTIPIKIVEESSSARCLIEVRVAAALKDTVNMAFLCLMKVRYEPKAHGNLPKTGAPMVSISATNDPSKKRHAKKGGLHVHTSKPSVSTSNPYDVLYAKVGIITFYLGVVPPLLRQNPSLLKDHGGVFMIMTIVPGSMDVLASGILILASLLLQSWMKNAHYTILKTIGIFAAIVAPFSLGVVVFVPSGDLNWIAYTVLCVIFVGLLYLHSLEICKRISPRKVAL